MLTLLMTALIIALLVTGLWLLRWRRTAADEALGGALLGLGGLLLVILTLADTVFAQLLGGQLPVYFCIGLGSLTGLVGVGLTLVKFRAYRRARRELAQRCTQL
ncbi:MAG TPA: hypothetical protein PKH77_12470 [Anaerolineae bacterium]|nr:hypothetical protein [Anaerolineae bacterium]